MSTQTFGNWDSVITSDFAVEKTTNLSEVQIDSLTQKMYWLESRPSEKGRSVVCRFDKHKVDLIPQPFNARSKVHEYGGASYVVFNDLLFFVNADDQNIYQVEGEKVSCIYKQENTRFANLIYSSKRNSLFAICEKHEMNEVLNFVAEISLSTNELKVLANSHDFYTNLVINPNESKIAFIGWDLPNMPWNESALYEFDLEKQKETLMYFEKGVSVCLPLYQSANCLFFIHDQTGFWNFYCHKNGQLETITRDERDYGAANWVFGISRYCFYQDQIIAIGTEKGIDSLFSIDLKSKEINPISTPLTSISYIATNGNEIFLIGANPEKPTALISLKLDVMDVKVLIKSKTLPFENSFISKPEMMEFPIDECESTYGIYYPPCNPNYSWSQAPPLVIRVHGGPTAMAPFAFDIAAQYFCSRGFAYLLINYRGSLGFGKKYRDRLNGNWGVTDIEDCCAATQFLAKKNLANPNQVAIRGSSAGGYTVLACAAFTKTFKVAVSYYGIGDLTLLAQDTHKFESKYLDQLIGPYPEMSEVYKSRSPLFHAEKISCPILIFQGEKDKVVPPSQAHAIIEKLNQNHIKEAHVFFPDEGHGFRNAENIKKALEVELDFYQQNLIN